MVEITALGSVLHSFYNGIENIFLSILKRCDQEQLTGDQLAQGSLDSNDKDNPKEDVCHFCRNRR
ncbi:MAG: hypothetical protein ACE1ZS_02375 [Candidatus Poribacteria bacterium]